MTVTLQVWDELRSAVLFDLNDPTGTNGGLVGYSSTKLAGDLDLGSPQLQSSTVEAQDIDATYSAFSKRATAEIKGKVIIQGTSYDNLVNAVGTLASFLTNGCVLKYVAGTNTYFIDVLPSDTPALLAGGDVAIYRAAALFQIDIDLSLTRQPYLRGAGLTAATNVLTNPTCLRDSNADGTPDSWTKDASATVTVVASTQACHVVAAAADNGIRQFTGAASASVGQVWTLSADVKVTSGTFLYGIGWYTSVPANISFNVGTTTSSTWTRVTLTATAPATTDRIQAALVSTGAAATFDVRNVQLELASSASKFRVGDELIYLDAYNGLTGFHKMMPVYNPGTAPAPMTITTAFPDASTNVQAMDYFLATSDGIPGNKYLSDYLNGPYYAQAEASGNGWTLTAGTDTTLLGAADATHSPGSGTTVARITHATDPHVFKKRITWTRSTLLDSLRGTHRVYAVVKPASKTKYRLILAWSAGSTTHEVNDEFVLEQTSYLAASRVLCDLGTIELPEHTSVTLTGLTLELGTKMAVGKSAANLDVDYLMLVPQDNSAHVELPGFEASEWSTTLGADMDVPKDLGAADPTWEILANLTVSGNSMILNAINEAVGVGSTTTGGFTGTAGGVHDVQYEVWLTSFIGTLNIEVANLSDNDLLDLSGNSMQLTNAYTTATNATIQHQIRVVEEAGDLYQPRVTITAYTSGSVSVRRVKTKPIYALSQNQQIRTDPGSTGPDRYAMERLDSSSNYQVTLDGDRVPFWIPPGLSLLWLEAYDVGTGPEELPHLNARTLTVTPTVYPRWWA